MTGTTIELPEVLDHPPDTWVERHEPEQRRVRGLDLLVSVLGVALLGGLSQLRHSWPAQVAELLVVVTVPGFVLLRALAVSPGAVRGFPLYILGSSLIAIMLAGLAVDLIAPTLGVARPLRTDPLTVGLVALCSALILIGAVRGAPSLTGAVVDAVPRPTHLLLLLLPALAWAGAQRLDNGHDTTVAIVAVAVSIAMLCLGILVAEHVSRSCISMLVFSASLALMLGFTLRGHFVYGFDISSEYQTFIQVLHAGRWHTHHPNDAYGAMLSLTILPSTIVALTGASPLLVLRVVYPLMFALIAVGLWLFAARMLRRRFAYLAVLLVVAQDFFFQQLPAIARQEIALLLLICLVFVLFDDRLRNGSRAGLLVVFGLGVVISHYGTTYLTVAVLGTAVVLEALRRGVIRRTGAAPLAWLAGALLLVSGLGAIWYAPVTDSGQNLSQFVSDLANKGVAILPTSGKQGLLGAYISGNVEATVSPGHFSRLARTDYVDNRRYRYIHPLAQANEPRYTLIAASAPTQRVVSHPALKALDIEQIVLTQLAFLIAAAGALVLWWRRPRGPTDGPISGVALLALATLGLLAFIRLSGTAANDYNQSRALLQALIPLSICFGWALQRLSARTSLRIAVPLVFACALGLVLLTGTGLRGSLLGGSLSTNLANRGEDYERFYVSAGDVAAARWLVKAAPSDDIVSADRYGQLQMSGVTGRPRVFGLLTPNTLDRNAWVYADSTNFVTRRARGEEGSSYLVFKWPTFIDHFWNLVYSNGSASVYARALPVYTHAHP